MKKATLQLAELIDILSDEDISLISTLVKKLVIAWDPEFTKVTPKEKELLEKSNSEIKNGDYVSEEDIESMLNYDSLKAKWEIEFMKAHPSFPWKTYESAEQLLQEEHLQEDK